MNKTAIYALLMALILPLVGYFIIKHYSKDVTPMPRRYFADTVITSTVNGKHIEDTVWHQMPDFSLTNQLGHKVGWGNMEGKVVVADFFFTHCPTICPRMTINMRQLQQGISSGQRVGDQQPRFVQFLSFTVDPERDSVPALKNWADRFQVNPDNWWLLTGDKKTIYDLSIQHMKVLAVDGQGVDTNFFHTDIMVLLDKNHVVRGYYHGLDSSSIGQLSRDIILVSLEKDPKAKGIFEGKLEFYALIFFLVMLGIVVLFYFLKRENRTHGFDSRKK